MANSRTRVFAVVCEAPKHVDTERLRRAIKREVQCIGGNLPPDDPLFEFDRNKVNVTSVKMKGGPRR